MAKKNEVEIKIKSTFDNKGVEEAKRETAELSKNTAEKASTANVDKDAKTAVEELTKAKKTLSRATATTKKNVEKLIESQEIANIAFEEAKPKVDELAKAYVTLDVATATARKNVKELSDANKRLSTSKKEVAHSTRQEETAQEKSTQTKIRAKSATDQLLASQTMLNKENVRAVQRGNKLNEGLIQLSYIVDDVQYGMRGILNNIPGLVMGFGASAGLAGAISIATLAGYKFYEWLNKEDEREEELATKRAERHAQFGKDLTENYYLLQKITQKAESDKLAKHFAENLHIATEELRQQNRLIERQISLRNNQVARENAIDTADIELKKKSTELDYIRGNISETQRDFIIDKLDAELQGRIRKRNIDKESFEISQLGEKSTFQDNVRREAWNEYNLLENIRRYLPNIQKASSVFEQQAQAFQLKQNALANGNTPSVETQVALKTSEEEIQKWISLFKKAGISLNIPYGEGSSVADRTNVVQKALAEFANKLKTSETRLNSETEKAEDLSAQISDKEDNLIQLKSLDKIATATADINHKIKQEKTSIAEEKRIEKERKTRQKEIESERYNVQREIARSGALDISDKARSTPKGISAIEAFNVGTAKLGESISQTDRNVSEAEMTSIILAMQQSLQKSGQHSKDLMAFLEKAMSKLVSRINNIEAQTNKELEQLKTGITRAVQQ